MQFMIPSSDPVLLEKARRVAQESVRQYMNDDVVGIVFLGAIARGYFMALHSASMEELERRRGAFMGLWEEMKPVIEKEAQMSFDEMIQIV